MKSGKSCKGGKGKTHKMPGGKKMAGAKHPKPKEKKKAMGY